jgi:hypothetical protein
MVQHVILYVMDIAVFGGKKIAGPGVVSKRTKRTAHCAGKLASYENAQW